jgi:hypothetical protein
MFSGVEQFEAAAEIFQADAFVGAVVLGRAGGDAVDDVEFDVVIAEGNSDLHMVIAADVFEGVLDQGKEEQGVYLLTVQLLVKVCV